MKTMRLPLSAVEGALIGYTEVPAPEARKIFKVDMSMRSLFGSETVVTVWVSAFDVEGAKVAALDALTMSVEFGEIKVENG